MVGATRAWIQTRALQGPIPPKLEKLEKEARAAEEKEKTPAGLTGKSPRSGVRNSGRVARHCAE